MSLFKRNIENGGFPAVHSRLSDMFDLDNFLNEPFYRSPMWNGETYSKMPATNIEVTDDAYIVELAAPGLKKKDFHVDVDNGTLEISVEKKEEKKEKEQNFTRREYSYKSFYRSFALPESANVDKIKAKYQDGILRVELEKVSTAKEAPIKEIAVA